MPVTNNLKVAFIVGHFPVVSETFILDQIVGLKKRGVAVTIFAFNRGSKIGVSDLYNQEKLEDYTIRLDYPKNFLLRLLKFSYLIFKLLYRPIIIFRALNFWRYGRNAWSLKLLFWSAAFADKKFDLIHCHFGTVANKYLLLREILNDQTPLITTFYGYDASHILKQKGPRYYDRLKIIGHLFLVMSNNMKDRLVAYGFSADRIEVLPVGLTVNNYPFKLREPRPQRPVEICSVGRFVEKKGFDDLLKALALVEESRPDSFRCEIVGGGPLEPEIKAQTKRLNLTDKVKFLGFKKIEEIIPWFMTKDLFIQPSKTASDGDME